MSGACGSFPLSSIRGRVSSSVTLRVVVAVAIGILLLGQAASAQDVRPASERPPPSRDIALGCTAAFTMTVSIIAAAYAVSRIGSAAMGAAAEKPELLTRSLLFVALAEGLAVLGFAIAMMMLQKI